MNVEGLQEEILELDVSEAKYYLLYLCETLKNEKLKDNDPLLPQTRKVVQSLKKLFTDFNKPNFDAAKDLPRLLARVEKEYQELYRLSHVGHYSNRIKKAVLQLCGFIAGLITFIPLGLVSMTYCFLKLDKHDWGTVHQLKNYFLTGAFVAGVLCTRYFESFEDKLVRKLRFSIEGLGASFKSIDDAHKNDFEKKEQSFMQAERGRILKEFFGDNKAAVSSFLESEQEYHLIGFKAQFLSENLKGYVGHHGTLVFKAGDKKRIIELGSDSSKEIEEPDQDYKRTCSGEKLIDMFVMHRVLQKQYTHEWANFNRLSGYKPGDYDCQNYVDTILASTSEPLSEVCRSIEGDASSGKAVCAGLKKWGVFSEKPVIPSEKDRKQIKDREHNTKRKSD